MSYNGFDRVMHYFREISRIPRGSGNTQKIADYCVQFAQEHSLRYVRDDSNNVIIYKGEKESPVILQGHTDMVCEAEIGTKKDFINEGITLIEKDGFMTADNTTLGADDGVAVAIMLALLENEDIPSVEAVFTSDEETGLIGASALDMSLLSGKTLINIDSEAEGVITAGCAGGRHVEIKLPIKREQRSGTVFEITVDGITGGHSGVEIYKNGANANKLLAKLLRRLNLQGGYIYHCEGGLRDNVITRKAAATLVFDYDAEEVVCTVCENYNKLFKTQFKETDPELNVSFKKKEETRHNAFSAQAVSALLCELPNGVLEKNNEGFVITSLNMGALKSEEDYVRICFGVRSNIEKEKEALCQRLRKISEKYNAEITEDGDYPGWEFKEKSQLREIISQEYKALTGEEARIDVIHAGLECGLFARGIKGFDAVSIGPDITDIHTPKEKLDLKSFERTYELVRNVVIKLSN